MPFQSKKVAYQLYKADVEDLPGGGRPVSEPYFYMAWREFRGTIKLRKWLKFALCDECTSYRQERLDNQRNTQALQDISERERAHHLFVKEERASYYKRKQLAVRNPQDYLPDH